MTPADVLSLAREAEEMRRQVVVRFAADLVSAAHVSYEDALLTARATCDEKWPGMAALIREHGEREVTC